MGPTLPISESIHAEKHRLIGESFREQTARLADSMKDSDDHFLAVKDILRDQRFLPAGRVQAAMGSGRDVTAFNCYVSGTIEDSMASIMQRATEAAETMRRGGGIGYDFSNLRPRGDRIVSLDSKASGPVSFMGIYDAVCQTIASAGHRRGAQMGVLRCDHPDIEEFVRCKQNDNRLTGFNISIGITDEFMEAVEAGNKFPLRYEGRVHREINARALWDEIMRSTWDWAEPGVLFIDRINEMNNLGYCETIAATNPCGEQPLPPHGACLLGSFNLVKYIKTTDRGDGQFLGSDLSFDWGQLCVDIPHIVRAMDNVIDRTVYPLAEQEAEAKAKRRMGLGVTGLANAVEALGHAYGTKESIAFARRVMREIAEVAYTASAYLAKEKGAFPLYDADAYMAQPFIKKLSDSTRAKIKEYGIRNSHLTSIAPTGTISLTADNVSSGVEPPFLLQYQRTIKGFDGDRQELVTDYAYREWGISGRTANDISAEAHIDMLCAVQAWVDSSVSKTCNVGAETTFDQFKELYFRAWRGGAKGCTTFRSAGKRFGVLNAVPEEPKVEACFIDPETGQKECE